MSVTRTVHAVSWPTARVLTGQVNVVLVWRNESADADIVVAAIAVRTTAAATADRRKRWGRTSTDLTDADGRGCVRGGVVTPGLRRLLPRALVCDARGDFLAGD